MVGVVKQKGEIIEVERVSEWVSEKECKLEETRSRLYMGPWSTGHGCRGDPLWGLPSGRVCQDW